MSLKTYLEGLYDYNDWANRRYLEAARTLNDEQVFCKQAHSRESVYGTFLHMFSTETVWLKRWRGEGPKTDLASADFPTLAVIQENWAELEKDMRTFLEAQDEQSLLKDTVCIGFNGGTFHLLLWQMMAHVPNHNTHHRSELAAMFTSMHVPHPEDEAVQYFLIQSGQREE